VATTFDPVSGGGACATASAANEPGTLNFRVKKAPKGGYTVLGSPTVIADFTLPGNTSQVAARLLDVDPGTGQETLVARGLWRPATGGPKRQVFQLHPAGWHFAAGHVAKLELLPKDNGPGLIGGYGRASNNQQPVKVKNLELRLPVREKPGALKGLVKAAKPKFVPRGYGLAADFKGFGHQHATVDKGPLKLTSSESFPVKVTCPKAWLTCRDGSVRVKFAPKRGRGFLLATGTFSLKGGQSKTIALAQGPNAFAEGPGPDRVRVQVTVRTRENPAPARVYRSFSF
jgi:hypothetical protein